MFNKVRHEQSRTNQTVIGIIGAHSGAGVTHTGLMISFYMGEALGQKTAFLECNSHGDMRRFQDAYEWTEEHSDYFVFHQTACYMDVDMTRLVEIMAQDYQWIIIDFGVDFAKWKSEFLRCKYKVVIGDGSEWNRHKFMGFVESAKVLPSSENWCYLMPYAKSKVRKQTKEMLALSKDIMEVPFDINPLDSTRQTEEFVMDLLS